MKRSFGSVMKPLLPRLLLLLSADGFFVLLLWLSEAKQLPILVGLLVLASLILFGADTAVFWYRQGQREKRFRAFLTHPDRYSEKQLLASVREQEREPLRLLASVLREQQNTQNELQSDLRDYEEYVEGWAHEAKTPLSLLTMLLDNRGEELSPELRTKLDYVRSQLQEDVTQILYYARLKAATKDYFFEAVNLRDCIEEVLEDYAPLLEEKQFSVDICLSREQVYTDRRGLLFMLGQIVGNAIKYSADAPKLSFAMEEHAEAEVLTIADNGVGVQPCDLPYIFQKGFTGDSTDSRKKATGMGLYLTKKMADDLKLKLDAVSEPHKGFAITIAFPKSK